VGRTVNTTPEQRVAAARARMAELAEKFILRSRDEIAILRSDLTRLGDGDAAALAEMVHIAHRMGGTGATLGLDALSMHAQRVERLANAQQPGAVPDSEALRQLAGAVDALADALQRPAAARS
jgi:chemotaxis protein histidine kinase CheA